MPFPRSALEAETARRSLRRFAQLAWPVVEPNPLRWNWHLDAMCDHLTAVKSGEIRRLVVAVPPGASKSLFFSTLYPAWDWIDDPSRRFLYASYAQELADKNADLHRKLVGSEWYEERFGPRLDPASATRVRNFSTLSKGWRFSSSVGGVVTGRHADVLVFDDLVKAQAAEGIDPKAIEAANQFWFKTMMTRKADAATTAFVGIAQRLHSEDTVGQCIDRGYTALILPMEYDPQRKCITYADSGKKLFEDPRTEEGELLDPARVPRVEVERQRQEMGPTAFECQLNQNPTVSGGLIFNDSWFQSWADLPEGLRKIITVDCAFKDLKNSDFVAIQCWGKEGNSYYLCDEIHARLNINGTISGIREMQERWPEAIGIYVEDKANGPAVVQMLGGELPVKEWTPKGSKVARAESAAVLFETGKVWLPPDNAHPWVAKYKAELTKFPLTKHDDRVDATSMALLILYTPERRRYADAVRRMRRG